MSRDLLAYYFALSVCILGGLYLVACLFALAYLKGHEDGTARGRELERMEPPLLGEVNFRDGWVRTVYAESASAAIEQVTR